MQEGKARRRCERVAGEQAREDGRGAGEDELASRAQPHGDGGRGEQNRRADEAEGGTAPFREVPGRECAVDAGTDRAGEDHEIPPHSTITFPFMSLRWSVQT
jgi:hypothetical protein